MSLRLTPFPKPSFISFLNVMSAISLTIVFVLVVFQPFGTSNFDHPYKFWILVGYGIITLLSGLMVYFLVNLMTSDLRLNRWSVVDEVIFLFFIILICQVSCYFYWATIFVGALDWLQFLNFFKIASLISLVPVSVYLLFIYQKYKEVKFVNTDDKFILNSEPKIKDQHLTIFGAGKNEIITVAPENLFLVKSEDNYVILFLYENGKIIKRMMRNTMSEIEQQIGSSFLRCHRSFIINPAKIAEIEGNITNTKISLTDIDTKIPVSRSMVEKVKMLI
ncbi:MAG: LytTR family DNA-binding domain-containing protein [Saprospiraceae bacterium]